MMSTVNFGLSAILTLALTAVVSASDCDSPEHDCKTPHKCFGNKAEIDPGTPSNLNWCERHARAGYPQSVSILADWSNTPSYSGYYVGGGNPRGIGGRLFGGEPRYVNCEGTWGWDYTPFWSRVRLNWWHGRRYEDGEGQYEANSKFLFPFTPMFGPLPK